MPTSALTPIWNRADVGIGPYELNSPNPNPQSGKEAVMKRILCCLALLLLLLAGCREPQAGPSLVGTWINEGAYSEGRDFVETLTLAEDGSAVIHLDYRGADYATLEGSWTALGDTLSVEFADPNTRDRVYTYTLTDLTLTLTGDGKEVVYQRVN